MNKKKVNIVIAISNIITLALIMGLYYLIDHINICLAIYNQTIFNSKFLDLMINNQELIIGGAGVISAFINIISAIQNKDNKKLCFWQAFFATLQIFILNLFYDLDIAKIIVMGVIPIVFGGITIFLSRKNDSRIVEVMDIGIGVTSILLAIVSIVSDNWNYWGIIAVIAQIFYTVTQNNNIIETRKRKILNIVVNYILRGIIVVILTGLTITGFALANSNKTKWKDGVEKLYVDMRNLKGNKSKDIIIPVENDSKYGFINLEGKEVIQCTYDDVSYFNKIEIDGNDNAYYIALAKKDDTYYIISKTNDTIEIEGDIKDYIKNLNYILKKRRKSVSGISYIDNSVTSDVQFSEKILKTIFEQHAALFNKEELEEDNEREYLSLKMIDSKLTYKNDKFSMLIEPLEEEKEITTKDDESLNIYGTKCNITITKADGKVGKETVYLIGLLEGENEIATFLNGGIQFITKDGLRTGWYDENGDKKTMSSTYSILSIVDDKVFLYKNGTNGNNEYIVINTSGSKLLTTDLFQIYGDNMNLIRKDNNKMVFINNKLENISKEYDNIFPNEFTSFYN